MKKLIVLVAAVAAVAISNAASVSWEVNSGAWKNQNGVSAAAGTTVWLINNEYATAIATALKNSAVVDFSSNTWKDQVTGITGVLGSSTTANAMGWVKEVEIANDQMEHDEYYNLATLLVDTTSASDTAYYMISDYFEEALAKDKLVEPEAELEYVSFESSNFGSWQVAQSTPEPTSGLLMLIGMAGLALRRRRA